jgi:hypothetical protein
MTETAKIGNIVDALSVESERVFVLVEKCSKQVLSELEQSAQPWRFF